MIELQSSLRKQASKGTLIRLTYSPLAQSWRCYLEHEPGNAVEAFAPDPFQAFVAAEMKLQLIGGPKVAE